MGSINFNFRIAAVILLFGLLLPVLNAKNIASNPPAPFLSAPYNSVDYGSAAANQIISANDVITAASLMGRDSYIYSNLPNLKSNGYIYTASMWIDWNAGTSNTPFAYGNGNSHGYGIYLFNYSGADYLGVSTSADRNVVYATAVPERMAGNWTMVTLVVAINLPGKMTRHQFYINGQPAATSEIDFNGLAYPNVSKFYIGNYGDPSNASLQAHYANVQWYTADESANVSAMYKSGISGAPVDTKNIAGWWMLNGTTDAQYGRGLTGVKENVTFTQLQGPDIVEILLNGVEKVIAKGFVSLQGGSLAPDTYDVNAIDVNSSASSNTVSLVISPQLNVSVVASANLIETGQTVTFNAIASGGKAPISYSWALNGNAVGSGSNTYILNGNQITEGTDVVSVIASDANSGSASASSTVTVNALPSVSIYVSANALDAGQSAVVSARVSGGVGPFTYNFVMFNSVTQSIIENQVGTGNTFSFTSNDSMIGGLQSNVVVTDSLHSVANSVYSETIAVNQPLGIASFGASANEVEPSNQIILSASVYGGTPPYTYNFTIFNRSRGISYSKSYETQNTTHNMTFNPSVFAGNVLEANVIITDSASLPVSVCSNEVSLYVAGQLEVAINPTYALVGVGQSVSFSSRVSGGFGPYSVLYSVSPNAIVSGNGITFSSAGTYNVSAEAVDREGARALSTNSTVRIGHWTNTTLIGVAISANSIAEFSYPSSNVTLSVNPSNNITANVIIINMTDGISSYPNVTSTVNQMVSKIVVLNISVASNNADSVKLVNITIGYPAYYVNPAPYQFNGVGWSEITSFSVDTSAHTITFDVPPDPTVGVFGFVPTQKQLQTQQQSSWAVQISGSGGSGILSGNYNSGSRPPSARPVINSTTQIESSNVINSSLSRHSQTAANMTILTNVTTNSDAISGTYNISQSKPVIFRINGLDISVKVTSNSSSTAKENVSVSKYVGTANLTGYDLMSALNISVSPASNVTLVITEGYECMAGTGSVQPFVLKNGVWIAIKNFSIDRRACQVTFSVSGDPVVALFAAKSQPKTTTVAQQTANSTATSGSSAPSSSSSAAVAAVIVLAVIGVVAAYAYQRNRGPGRKTRKA